MPERVLVVGPGAIGSLLAAHLARTTETWVLTRRPEHAQALARHGITVSGRADFTSRPRARVHPQELPELDVVFMATKATYLQRATAALKGYAPGATVVTLQNGLGAEDVVRRQGGWQIVAGTTLMGGVRHSDTHIEYELDAPTWLGPCEETATPLMRVAEIASLLVASGLKAEVFADLRPARWSKLIFNAVVATISALTGVEHSREMVATEGFGDLGNVFRDAIEEGKAIAAAAGVELLEDPWELSARPIEEGLARGMPYSHAPSMLLDAAAGTPTEYEFNIGALAREAARHGVDAPLTTAIYRLWRARELASTGDLTVESA